MEEHRQIYHDAAFLFLVLMCDRCDQYLDSERDLGIKGFDGEDWHILLGNEGHRRGWKIAEDSSLSGFSILCPKCAGGCAPDQPFHPK
jgi:hypothetical protein